MNDINAPVEKPIEVPVSAVPEATMTLIRYLLVTLGGVFVSKGWLSDSDLNAIVGALLIIGPTIYGIIRTQRNHAKLLTVAEDRRVPDTVARVK